MADGDEMKIVLLATGKQIEVLREKPDYYIIGVNGERIYKRVEGEEFVVVGKEYSWGVVPEIHEEPPKNQEPPKPAPSPFPPIVVKINYEDSETMEKRLKEFSHK